MVTQADVLRQAGYPAHAALVTPAPVPIPPIPVPPDPVGGAIASAVNAGSSVAAGLPSALSSAGSTVAGAIDGLASLATAGVRAGNWLSNRRNWVRIAYVAGGVSLVLGAMLMIVTQRAEGRASSLLGTGVKIFSAVKGRGAAASKGIAA